MKKSLLMILTIIMSLFILTDVTNAKELDINNNEVKELYKKIPDEQVRNEKGDGFKMNTSAYMSNLTTNSQNSSLGVLYKAIYNLSNISNFENGEKVTIQEIKDSGAWNILCGSNYSCSETEENGYWTAATKFPINKEKISNEVKKIIGKENETKFNYQSIYDFGFVCSYKNDEYYCYYTEGGDAGFTPFSKIIKAEENNDVVTLYDKYVFWKEGSFYTSYDLQKLIIKDDNSEIRTIDNFEKTYGEGSAPTYMHTFKKDSEGNYYWESTKLYKDTIGVKKREKIEVPNTGIINVYTISSVIILGAVILFIVIKRKSEMM